MCHIIGIIVKQLLLQLFTTITPLYGGLCQFEPRLKWSPYPIRFVEGGPENSESWCCSWWIKRGMWAVSPAATTNLLYRGVYFWTGCFLTICCSHCHFLNNIPTDSRNSSFKNTSDVNSRHRVNSIPDVELIGMEWNWNW